MSEQVLTITPHVDNINSNIREINWEKGSPYTWTINEKTELESSGNLFARKFSTATPECEAIVDYFAGTMSGGL